MKKAYLDFFLVFLTKWSIALLPSSSLTYKLVSIVLGQRTSIWLHWQGTILCWDANQNLLILNMSFGHLCLHWFFSDFLLPRENPYLKLKHVVTTCIHLSGISSECGIHNLKRENSWCIINTMLYECVFFACFHSTLTQTSFACLPKISIVLSILQWKRYANISLSSGSICRLFHAMHPPFLLQAFWMFLPKYTFCD